MEVRSLIITADDYGIGSATSRGIRELAVRGRVTAALLLVNSQPAERAVREWRRCQATADLGWHPCLTLDEPVLRPSQLPSLVDAGGRFWQLGAFLRRLYLGLLRREEIEAELRAQYERFRNLTGHFPAIVAAHHHLHLFEPVGTILRGILNQQRPLPYVRRVREPWHMLRQIPGARLKRLLLAILGGRSARHPHWERFPGNDWSARLPTADMSRWAEGLERTPGRVVELVCHPGRMDHSLIGRDGTTTAQPHRVHERQLLDRPGLVELCRQAGFQPARPSHLWAERAAHAA